MKAFVINLKSNPDRRAFMEEQLKRLDLDFEFFDGIVGAKYHGDPQWHAPHKSVREISRELRPGEVGCALSHAFVYREIVRRGLPCAFVMEDDAILHDDVPRVLERLELGELEQGELVFLERCDFIRPFSSRPLVGRYRIATPVLVKIGSVAQAAGYVISLEAARAMMNANVPVFFPADGWGFYKGLVRYRGVTPTLTLIRQRVDFGSTTTTGVRPEMGRHNLFMILGYGFFMYTWVGKRIRRVLKRRGLMR
jgi:glycosyl transferase, family 25